MARTTNTKQYEKLVNLLEPYPDIAQGYSKRGKDAINLFWEDCSTELNFLGPPTKTSIAWRKVWVDYKCYIKKKLAQNKKEVNATGGGPNRQYIFTDTEETVIRITGIGKNVEGIADSLRFGATPISPLPEVLQEVSQNVVNGSRLENTPRLRNPPHKKNEMTELLKTQIEIQKNLNSNMEKIYRGIDKSNEIKEKNLCEMKRHNKIMEELESEKIKIKKRKYED